jgi:GNAT superfamily N-acetyltransferase
LGVKKLLAERELEFLTGVDHHDHEAIGAVDAATGVGVGVGRFIRFQPGGEVAEAAVAIVDEWQGRGLGRILIDRLAHRAREEGVARLRASVLASNRAMIRLFQRVGPVRVIEREGETEELEIELRP